MKRMQVIASRQGFALLLAAIMLLAAACDRMPPTGHMQHHAPVLGEALPAAGAAGTLFRVNVHGFAAEEDVKAYLADPDGAVQAFLIHEAASAASAKGLIIGIPVDSTGLRPGTWTLGVVGEKSDNLSYATFVVVAP